MSVTVRVRVTTWMAVIVAGAVGRITVRVKGSRSGPPYVVTGVFPRTLLEINRIPVQTIWSCLDADRRRVTVNDTGVDRARRRCRSQSR